MEEKFHLKREQGAFDSTIDLIESIHSQRKMNSIIVNPQYLDDEKLTNAERLQVLSEIFNLKIRKKQLSRIISHLSPVLDEKFTPSALIYGPTGSGKTVTLFHVLSRFTRVCRSKGIRFDFEYIDLSSPKTFFAALNTLAMAFDDTVRRYRKGVPIEYMQERIVKALEQKEGYLCLLIDEIDNLRPSADEFLTFLSKTLPPKVGCRIILVMLTNRLDWEKALDPRIISFLKKEDIIFEPYDAMDLAALLKLRVHKALDSAKVEESAIRKIAAMASRETGDARKAVELLAMSVAIAEGDSGRLTGETVDLAEKRLEVDKTNQLIQSLAPQQRFALKACCQALLGSKSKITTGQAFAHYSRICQEECAVQLSQRRFSDLISFLDLYGLINAQIISKGRYGNTRDISMALPRDIAARIASD